MTYKTHEQHASKAKIKVEPKPVVKPIVKVEPKPAVVPPKPEPKPEPRVVSKESRNDTLERCAALARSFVNKNAAVHSPLDMLAFQIEAAILALKDKP